MSNEEFTPFPETSEQETVVPNELLALEQMESEGGSAREELLRAFGEADEEVQVESLEELRRLLLEQGIPAEEVDRKLTQAPE